jgi:hypothetical protein
LIRDTTSPRAAIQAPAMPSTRPIYVLSFLALASTPAFVRAQANEPRSLIPDVPAWRLAIEPSAWYPAAGGDLKLPGTPGAGNGQQIKLELLNIDSPRLSTLMEVRGRHDRWNFSASGFSISTSDRLAAAEFTGQFGGLAINTGDLFKASFDLTSLEAIIGYTAYPDFTAAGEKGLVRANLDLLAGLRSYDMSVGVSTPSGASQADELFVEPIVGARLTLDLSPYASIEVQSTIGGFSLGDTHSLSWDIISGFQWRPTKMLGVQIGYRNLLLDLQSGREPRTLDYFGAVAGVYFGGVLRF